MILSNAKERVRFSDRYDEFKKELVLDPKLDWKENWDNNKNITNKWKKLESDLFPEYSNYVDTIESRGKTSELFHITIGYNGLNIYQICFWYEKIYEEFLATANLLDMNEDNQLLIVRELHYDDEEGYYYGSELDDYLRDCGWDEDSIRERNEEGLSDHYFFYRNRRKLLSERLKINTIDEIRYVFKHFLEPKIEDKYRSSLKVNYYPKSIKDLDRVYNDIKNGKPY